MRQEQLEVLLTSVIKEILAGRSPSFTGAGIVVFDKSFDHSIHTDIYPDFIPPMALCLKSRAAIDFLLELGCRENPYHDGFSFVDEKGNLTCVAQYVTPHISGKVDVPEGLGARYMTGYYTSITIGVMLTAIVCNHGSGYLFEQGKARKIS